MKDQQMSVPLGITHRNVQVRKHQGEDLVRQTQDWDTEIFQICLKSPQILSAQAISNICAQGRVRKAYTYMNCIDLHSENLGLVCRMIRGMR